MQRGIPIAGESVAENLLAQRSGLCTESAQEIQKEKRLAGASRKLSSGLSVELRTRPAIVVRILVELR